jgi:hypothetical protein
MDSNIRGATHNLEPQRMFQEQVRKRGVVTEHASPCCGGFVPASTTVDWSILITHLAVHEYQAVTNSLEPPNRP